MPDLAAPSLPCHVMPHLALPYPSMPRLPRLAETRREPPHQNPPALPRLIMPCRNLPHHACLAMSDPALPMLTQPCLPHHAVPHITQPYRTQPDPACLTLPDFPRRTQNTSTMGSIFVNGVTANRPERFRYHRQTSCPGFPGHPADDVPFPL